MPGGCGVRVPVAWANHDGVAFFTEIVSVIVVLNSCEVRAMRQMASNLGH